MANVDAVRIEVAGLVNRLDANPEERRELYAKVHGKLSEIRRAGVDMPRDLLQLEYALIAESCAESQGR
jgi:hypothetical protein